MGNKVSETAWFKFEKLTGFLFQQEYGLKPHQFQSTRATKDGGKDGMIQISVLSDILDSIELRVWIEAKYRSASNVAMNDIGGNVLIAFNSQINKIYFVTNRFFTPQAVQELLTISLTRGLEVELVTGYHYRKLLEKHFAKINPDWNAKFQIPKPDILEFATELLDKLPSETPAEINIEPILLQRGKPASSLSSVSALTKKESKIEQRILKFPSSLSVESSLDLSIIRPEFVVSDREIRENPEYRIVGRNRRKLLRETISLLVSDKTVVLRSKSGEGKTFLSNHVARDFYKRDYAVIFIETENKSLFSISRLILMELTGIGKIERDEYWNKLVAEIAQVYSINFSEANEILSIIAEGKEHSNLTPELYSNVLSKLISIFSKRKRLLLVVDNLHAASRETLSFLKNLFSDVNRLNVPVLALSQVRNPHLNINDPDWRHSLDSLFKANEFAVLDVPGLSTSDIHDLIEQLVPGASDSLKAFIEKSTLRTPLYIKLYIEHLKNEGIIETYDGLHWIINSGRIGVYQKLETISSPRIGSLVTEHLRGVFKSQDIYALATTIFLFNNQLPESVFETLHSELNIDELVKTDLFHAWIENDDFNIGFSHELYYNHTKSALSSPVEELNLACLKLLRKIGNLTTLSGDVLGNLNYYSGNTNEAYRNYRDYAEAQHKENPLKSCKFFESALESVLLTGHRGDFNYDLVVEELSFTLLDFYQSYGLLTSEKCRRIINLIEKLEVFGQLASLSKAKLLFFKGQRETLKESFWDAREFFQSALGEIQNVENSESEGWKERILVSIGINLKHIGLKDESVAFFSEQAKLIGSQSIEYARYANKAAYYLTTNPRQSLSCFQVMRDKLVDGEDVHLKVDFGMAYFYLKEYAKSRKVLDDAIERSRRLLNPAEESRAQNIIGLIHAVSEDYPRSEYFLDLANSNCELANNYRWLWRIRCNLAQVSWENGRNSKSLTLGWSVLNHLERTKEALRRETLNEQLNSRRFAAFKGTIYVLFKIGLADQVDQFVSRLGVPAAQRFWMNLQKNGSTEFDQSDTNRFGDKYLILG